MYKISQEQLQQIVNYLVNKPYIEVVDLIEIIRSLQIIEEKKDE